MSVAFSIALLLLLAMALISIRLVRGPTLYDRALAAHAFIFVGALAAAAIGAASGQAAWIFAAVALVVSDLAIAIAVLKFFRYRSLQPPLSRPTPREEREA